MKRVYHMNRVHVYEFGDIAAGWPSCLFLMFISVHCIFRSVSLSFLFVFVLFEISKTRSLWLTNKPFDFDFDYVCWCVMGPFSISEKTSYYHKISQSLEATRFVYRIVRSLWNLTGTSAVMLPRFLLISKRDDDLNYQISRLRDFARFYD